jgi:hypothetical protein
MDDDLNNIDATADATAAVLALVKLCKLTFCITSYDGRITSACMILADNNTRLDLTDEGDIPIASCK